MIKVEDREKIRRAYFVEKKSIREIARELHHGRETVKKALESAAPATYTLEKPRPAPVLGPYKERIAELLEENATLPRKQRYTGHQIFGILQEEGYTGAESTVRGYLAQCRGARRHKRPVYLPLAFDPGVDAQVDWGEAEVILAGEPTKVQLFVIRLCYSRRTFVMAFPSQKQEAFFEGHVRAFEFFGGVPERISYDNLKVAVLRVLEGRNREEQAAFIQFRSHYLFKSRFCTPGQGHEKGGVEHDVKFTRRNYLPGRPALDSFEALNARLLARCRADDDRRVDRQPLTIGEAWQQERPLLRERPEHAFDCCAQRVAQLNGYSQVVFETNRYSVPADQAYRNLMLKAYPFHIEVLWMDQVLARHPRSYAREQDIVDPLHYLPLLEQRPGAFEHARPLRQWRETWPPVYEELLTQLRERWPEGRGVREFVQVLKLHRQHPAEQIAAAITEALAHGCAHVDGVKLCLHQLQHPEAPANPLDLTAYPALAAVGNQPPDLRRYDQLLGGGAE